MVVPIQTCIVVLTRSTTAATRNSSSSIPPSVLTIVLRWKPVAMRCLGRRVREQIAGDLLDRELIERQVPVERLDDPVAIGPDRAPTVLLVAVGVGVASLIEPGPCLALAVMARCEQSIDQPFVCIGALVVLECIDLGGRRRQADQVEADAANQGRAVSLGRRAQSLAFQAGQHEVIDRVP